MNHVLRAFQCPLRFRLYPTGEFSATRIKECASLLPATPSDGWDEAGRLTERSVTRKNSGDKLYDAIVRSTLGSSNVPNSHKPVKPRGRKGLTRYNKRFVVNSVTLLERKYEKKCLSFLTLTLPAECASRAPELYAECKRQMSQWLQRRLVRCGLPDLLIGCTEVQSGRLASKGQFALHEHWIFVGRGRHKTWSLRPSEVQEVWLRILDNVYKLAGSIDKRGAATRIESIKKSAAAYLGKYVSKGEKCVQQLIQDGYEEFLPSSWVTKTASMLAMFRASIVNIEGELAQTLMDTLQSNCSIFCRWSRNLRIPIASGVEIWLGFIGYLSIDGLKMFNLLKTNQSLTPVLKYG